MARVGSRQLPVVLAVFGAVSSSTCAAPEPPAATTPQAPSPAAIPPAIVVIPPKMVFSIDMTTAPIGVWAEYAETDGTMVLERERIAIVARGPEGTTVDRIQREGLFGKDEVVISVLLPAGSHGRASQRTIQVNAGRPSTVTVRPEPEPDFIDLSVMMFVTDETVATPAGNFVTKHYRGRNVRNENVDCWMSNDVLPLGLVRLVADYNGVQSRPRAFKYELVARGTDAKPAIVPSRRPD